MGLSLDGDLIPVFVSRAFAVANVSVEEHGLGAACLADGRCVALLESTQRHTTGRSVRSHADDVNRSATPPTKQQVQPRRHAMLAEIFMLRLEAAARAAKEAANSSRFVPITFPTAKMS